jgi:hypothetical protein
VHALIVAAINPDNTPHGYNWTYAFPMLLFIVIALVLWGLFGRPHHRVPARPLSLSLSSRVADADTARAASVAGGLSVAPGGGASESDHEPSGAHLVASTEAESESSGADDGSTPPAGGGGASQ